MVFCTIFQIVFGPPLGFLNYLISLAGLEALQPLSLLFDFFGCQI